MCLNALSLPNEVAQLKFLIMCTSYFVHREIDSRTDRSSEFCYSRSPSTGQPSSEAYDRAYGVNWSLVLGKADLMPSLHGVVKVLRAARGA